MRPDEQPAAHDRSTLPVSLLPPQDIPQHERGDRKFSLERLDKLQEQLLTGPHYLLWSFMALTLMALRLLSIDNTSSSTDDSVCRAHWSVFMLERLFVPPMPPNAFGPGVPEFPISAPKPLAPQSTLLTAIPERAQAQPRTILSSDPGIIGVHMRLVSIWGKLRFYLHGLRRGVTEKPWSPDSTHTKLNIEMIEHEALIDSSYFLSKALLPSRTSAEISLHREHWDPFMASQIIWHAIHAVLNHPFVHLFLLRSSKDVPPSCLFLQQRIDMALFHTGSLFRILQSFMDLMNIVDPMVADFVAAAATVSWFFQFSADPKISRRAREELDKCDAFLSHVAETWPHVSQKLETLRKLEALANENRRQHSDEGTNISFQSAWLWDLLNPKIQSTQTAPSHSGSGTEKRPDSEMYLKSHFVMPLHDDHESGQTREPMASGQDGMDSLFTMPGDLDLFNIELLSHDFFENGLWDQSY
ncbi:hypothetical protein FDENT_11871 [Fusarium denticulatum]|uniref:Transcription factor domain-containing protein n=1 Tax=Fusarium denticulatum TaxID=48507 RepID=A0A8H5WRF5_9HYPO|nr:hypothetical protein FDENT_11871 [Fusarium denticulatum]